MKKLISLLLCLALLPVLPVMSAFAEEDLDLEVIIEEDVQETPGIYEADGSTTVTIT